MAKIVHLNDYKIIKNMSYSTNADEQNDDLIYLGSHSYSSMPGMSWRTEYWIKISSDGKNYSLYCTDDESDDPNEKILYEDFSAKGLLEYFDEVGFEFSNEDLNSLKINRD